jgi:ribosomal protein S21
MILLKPFDLSRIKPIEVVVEGSSREDLEQAIRKFKLLTQKERVIGQYKEKMSYETPTQKKRRKAKEARERMLANDRREQLIKSGEWDKKQKQKVVKQIKKEEKKVAGTYE